jgi:hypothetical protein
MLAEAIEIEPELVGERDFLQQVAQPFGRALQAVVVERVGCVLRKSVPIRN